MKPTRLFLVSLAAGAVLPAAGLFGQAAPAAASPAATPSVSAPASPAKADADEEAGGDRLARFKALTPEEQTKLRAARKAAAKDPAVIAAEPNRKTDRRAFNQALQAAMIKADPAVAPILEKMKAARRERRKGA